MANEREKMEEWRTVVEQSRKKDFYAITLYAFNHYIELGMAAKKHTHTGTITTTSITTKWRFNRVKFSAAPFSSTQNSFLSLPHLYGCYVKIEMY